MSLKDKVTKEVNLALDNAEDIWAEVGFQFEKGDKALEGIVAFDGSQKVETPIPGFPFIEEGKPQVGKFIAQVLDIRDSTTHLTRAISKKVASASQLERVLYETTAINTAGSVIIEYYNGAITEYLGDGYLALFKEEDNEQNYDVYNAYNSAEFYLNNGLPIVNSILFKRYGLPNLQIGIGMAYSKAIVTLIGRGDNLHAKAIGECVYRASKIADGTNEIKIENKLRFHWPKGKDGKIGFRKLRYSKHEFDTFIIH
jgi:hypothetical protein